MQGVVGFAASALLALSRARATHAVAATMWARYTGAKRIHKGRALMVPDGAVSAETLLYIATPPARTSNALTWHIGTSTGGMPVSRESA